ncbi:MAG: BrnT family toxin [Xenococcaceae cyanobacterium MO_188.B32]|nr:BrnT family toxin [Xenococcaceae cyanobacterium MO_188.B32]
MQFEWDESKNAANLKKHGISFEEAKLIFDNVVFTSIDDRFDYEEIREISIGAIESLVVVTVVHTDRGEVTRIISARKATKKERKKYYEYLAKTTRRT